MSSQSDRVGFELMTEEEQELYLLTHLRVHNAAGLLAMADSVVGESVVDLWLMRWSSSLFDLPVVCMFLGEPPEDHEAARIEMANTLIRARRDARVPGKQAG